MDINKAKSILRITEGSHLDPVLVKASFIKMARRYPVEQFPERFSEIRNAYQVLSDPSREIKSLLFEENPDITSIFAPMPCLNEAPRSPSERKVISQLALLLRSDVVKNAINAEDEFDDEGFDDMDFDFENLDPLKLAEFESIINAMEDIFSKPSKTKRKRQKGDQ